MNLFCFTQVDQGWKWADLGLQLRSEQRRRKDTLLLLRKFWMPGPTLIVYFFMNRLKLCWACVLKKYHSNQVFIDVSFIVFKIIYSKQVLLLKLACRQLWVAMVAYFWINAWLYVSIRCQLSIYVLSFCGKNKHMYYINNNNSSIQKTLCVRNNEKNWEYHT